MSDRSSHRVVRWFAVMMAIAAAAAFGADKKKKAATPSPSPALMEIIGGILEVKLFALLEETREKMAKFKLVEGAKVEPEENEEREAGERLVWRLAGTDYQWIVAWADKGGKIVKISASVRPEKKKPFGEIGDLTRAKMHDDSTALWIVQRPDGSRYRLVARGPSEQAVSVYMYSLKAEPMD